MPLDGNVDLCVIGGGAAGLSVAAGAALLGVEVALIERDRMGGECLNTGCVPSKALLAAAKAAQSTRDAKSFGIDAEPSIDFKRVHAHVRSVIDAIAPHDSAEIRGTGR
jgi:pyruvate/2-oxoglutarate dehydrogenase complex dihydrolipoamide dehydrogenase (E3) component